MSTDIATKQDIEGLQAATQKDIEGLRKDTKALVLEMKNDLIKWIVGTMAGTIISLTALAFAFAPYLRQ